MAGRDLSAELFADEVATGSATSGRNLSSELFPVSVKAGSLLNDIPRQLGLTARYGLEGLANTAQLMTEPIRNVTNLIAGSTVASKPLGVVATEAANWMGLPTPQGANERVIGDASRLVAGTGAMAGAASLAAKVPGMVGTISSFLGANPMQQLTSAAGAGLAGGASREAGGSPLMEAGAAAVGGITGGFVPSLASGTVNVAKSLLNANMTSQQLDAKISIILRQTGVDYSQVPERLRQSMRAEMAGSLQANKEFSPEAVSRLLDFQRVGATPSRGMVSQDPIQITREMNLAKTGANSGDEALHGMALLQNQNNKTLIRSLNNAGALDGDAFAAGQSAIGAINSRNDASGKVVSGLYDAARAMPGGNTQLDRKSFVDGIYNSLAKENKMAYLPEDISNTINSISSGQVTRNGQTFTVPFDANALDNLMTDIAAAQRGTSNGSIKRALTLARAAIDATPLQPLKAAYGGNQMVTDATASGMRNADVQAGDFMGALNQARQAASARFDWQKSTAPIEAAVGGVEPDKFIQRFVINGSLSDAQSVAQNAGLQASKDAIVAHLKDRALNSADDGFGKFSQAAYQKAITQIGDRKLSVFFSPEELGQLKAVGRVASAMQVQPVGSAVNNSNSAAMLLGKGYDALKAGIGMIPGAGPITAGILDLTLGAPTKNAANWMGQRTASNLKPGLLLNPDEALNYKNLLLPGMAMGGLLAAP